MTRSCSTSGLRRGLLACALSLATVPMAAQAADINLTYAFFAPAGTFPGKQMAHWAEQVAKRTNGKVAVKTFPGGTSFGDTTVVNAFSLGGPFQLGAYYPGELRGSNAVVANLGYFHELARFAEGTIGRLWFGGLVEEGSAFEQWSAAKFHTNVTTGFVLESPIGPVFAGASFGLDGRYRVYFSLGPIIK